MYSSFEFWQLRTSNVHLAVKASLKGFTYLLCTQSMTPMYDRKRRSAQSRFYVSTGPPSSKGSNPLCPPVAFKIRLHASITWMSQLGIRRIYLQFCWPWKHSGKLIDMSKWYSKLCSYTVHHIGLGGAQRSYLPERFNRNSSPIYCIYADHSLCHREMSVHAPVHKSVKHMKHVLWNLKHYRVK